MWIISNYEFICFWPIDAHCNQMQTSYHINEILKVGLPFFYHLSTQLFIQNHVPFSLRRIK